MSAIVESRVGRVAQRQARPAWMEKPRKATLAAKGVALVVIIVLVLTPFLVVVSTSLASPQEVIANNGWVLWPQHPTLEAYRQIFSGTVVTHALGVSVGVTLFPPGMIPTYLMVKNLGLLDNYLSLIAPMLISVFNLVVLRGFFQSVPEELFEAARLDGAGNLRILLSIVLPLSKAALAVVGLFYAVAYWNSWFQASIYMNEDHWPLQQVLRTYVLSGAQLANSNGAGDSALSAPQTVQMSVLVVATVPILVIYPFLQKYFSKGVLTGAIKS